MSNTRTLNLSSSRSMKSWPFSSGPSIMVLPSSPTSNALCHLATLSPFSGKTSFPPASVITTFGGNPGPTVGPPIPM